MLLFVFIIGVFILLSFLTKSTNRTRNHSTNSFIPYQGSHDHSNYSSTDGGNDCGGSFGGSDGGGCSGGGGD
ncbi:hypothetical protein [Niallia nealsonii]|uniref:Methanol dehydrogenase n=1 Tax=Niallia nealsonii TaxID=115979 RepID=A0A2N0Z304_9BACI|nr:hypothetical protein [Niallia nealsonii]PKG23891.1 hypothetical protein CWS01_08955 [Niallia nealsonii]